jgi:hypothetical protein
MAQYAQPWLGSGAERLTTEAQGIFEQADREGRALSGDERVYVTELLERAKSLKATEDLGRELGVGMPNVSMSTAGHGGGPGDRFIASAEYKRIKDPSARGQLEHRPGSGV